MRTATPLVLIGLAWLFAPLAAGQKKPPAKGGPRVLLALPFGVKPGATTRLTLRGRRLDSIKEVRCLPKGAVKVVKKGKVPVPNMLDPGRAGDTQVEIELSVPADVPGGKVELVPVTPAGEGPPHGVLLDRTPPVAEKEPNDSFKQAQPVKVGQAVQGAIGTPQDVDVYRVEGKAGQKLVLEVEAARRGSLLDSVLTLYDARGEVLATNDDTEDSTDSRLEVTLPRAGTYYVGVTDAHDLGGPLYAYRLSVRAK